jgi:hypothetical protein
VRRPPVVITLEMYEAMQEARRAIRDVPSPRPPNAEQADRLLRAYGRLQFAVGGKMVLQ